jgi:hypothetical protein
VANICSILELQGRTPARLEGAAPCPTVVRRCPFQAIRAPLFAPCEHVPAAAICGESRTTFCGRSGRTPHPKFIRRCGLDGGATTKPQFCVRAPEPGLRRSRSAADTVTQFVGAVYRRMCPPTALRVPEIGPQSVRTVTVSVEAHSQWHLPSAPWVSRRPPSRAAAASPRRSGSGADRIWLLTGNTRSWFPLDRRTGVRRTSVR